MNVRKITLILVYIMFNGIAFAQSGQSDSAVVRFLEQNYNVRFSHNNSVVYFKSGQEKFDDLFKAIKQAKHSIHLEYFNFRNDSISHLLFNLLREKAKQGVEVRALFDGFGNTSNDRPIKAKHLKTLRMDGIDIVEFDPIKAPYLQNSFHRDHRKIVVIDGMIAYTGGMNVADYYITGKPEFGDWRDLHCRVEGDIVAELQKVFIDFWNKETHQNLQGTQYYPGERNASQHFQGLKPDTTSHKGKMTMGVINRIPRKSSRIIEQTFIQILKNAQHKVQLVNPYFTLTRKISKAFQSAIKRGVKVEIMVSSKSDIPVTPDVVEFYSDKFRKMGATIHIFTDGFHHSKAMMVDDTFVYMGSANLNGRSMRFDYECNILIVDNEATKALQSIYNDDIKNHCTTLLPEHGNVRPPLKRLKNWFMQLLSPLL